MKMYSLIVLAALQSRAFAAPQNMASTVEALSKAAGEIKTGISKESNIKVTAKAKALQDKIETLWLEAVTVHVDVTEDKLKELGFFPKIDEGNGFQYLVGTNANGKELKKKARQMNLAGWPEVLAAAKEGPQNTAGGRALLEQSRSKDGISESYIKDANLRLSPYKDDAFNVIRRLAERAIECVGHVSQQMEQQGLRTVQVSEGVFEWSSEDLRRVYGVKNIEAATAEQRRRMLNGINAILNLPPKTLDACISPEHMDFFNAESAKLQGGR